MTPEEIKAVIVLVQRAPLQNMAEAEAAAHLIKKLQALLDPPVAAPKTKRKA